MELKKIAQLFGNLTAILIIAYSSYLLILLSIPFTSFEPGIDFLETKQLIYHITTWRWSFYIHVFTSPLIIITGLFQFNRKLIRYYPRFHKASGYIYIITTLFISGPAAFVMSLWANGGRIAQLSFVILTILWMAFTYLSYFFIRKGKIEQHVKWIIRSYALTLSAVSLRFYAYLFDAYNLDLPPKETYILLSWISWPPNLLFAELLIIFRYPKYLLQFRNL